MKMSMDKGSLLKYVKRQLDFYLPDEYEIDTNVTDICISDALHRCEKCFRHILISGYRYNGEAAFSHLHMDQYATFLYFLANSIWQEKGDKLLCDKLLNLNRILNGFFISYKCQMPDVFLFGHPVGSVIGNADYSDGLVVNQNVTINTRTDEYGKPKLKIGKGCYLGSGAKIIGSEEIGERCSIGTDVLIYNRRVETDSVCLRDETGKVVIRPRIGEKCMAASIFDLEF